MKREIALDKHNGETEKISCAQCNRLTDHEILSSVNVNFSNDEARYWEQYTILECKGCHDVAFKKSSWGEDDYEKNQDGTWDLNDHVEIYPSRLADRKKLEGDIRGFGPLPRDIFRVYDETYMALCNQQTILCAAGLRILLERICINIGAEGRDLEKRIEALKTKGDCSEADAVRLHGTRLFGNEVVHEAEPRWSELQAAFDVIEHLMNTIYILPTKAKPLKEREENRRKSSKKNE